jgi:hypothetical protein
MKLLAFLAAFSLALPLAAADLALVDNDESITVDCAADPNVTIAGNNATVTLVGTCKVVMLAGNHATITGSALRVALTGNENTALLDGVDTLSFTGNDNTASWKRPLDPRLKQPRISNLGTKNSIAQSK